MSLHYRQASEKVESKRRVQGPFVTFAEPIEQAFPFRITIAKSAEDLNDLVELRYAAYVRHKVPFAERLRGPETHDQRDDAVLVLARAKDNQAVVGSVRIQTRLVRSLLVESAMALPVHIQDGAPLELVRGSVKNGSQGRLVAAALAKASFQIALRCGFGHIVITCREPVNHIYRAYCFDELLEGAFIDLPYLPGVKHQVLSLPVADARARWVEQNPTLHRFMMITLHPDIDIDYDHISRMLPRPGSQ